MNCLIQFCHFFPLHLEFFIVTCFSILICIISSLLKIIFNIGFKVLHIFLLSKIGGLFILQFQCSMWSVIFSMSLPAPQGLSLCTVHLFWVLRAPLQWALCLLLPGPLRLSLVHQTYISSTTLLVQELVSTFKPEGDLNLGLLMGYYCFSSPSEPKSHSLHSFTLACRRSSSHLLFFYKSSFSRASTLLYTRLSQSFYTFNFRICLVLNSFFVSSM